MDSQLDKLLDEVSDKQSLSKFIMCLHNDLLANSKEWESVTLESYLERMSAVIDDTDENYFDFDIPSSSWKLFALLLVWASRYE